MRLNARTLQAQGQPVLQRWQQGVVMRQRKLYMLLLLLLLVRWHHQRSSVCCTTFSPKFEQAPQMVPAMAGSHWRTCVPTW